MSREFRYTGRFREPPWRGPIFSPLTPTRTAPPPPMPGDCRYCGMDCSERRGCLGWHLHNAADQGQASHAKEGTTDAD